MTNSTSTRSTRHKCSHQPPGPSADVESANSASTEADDHWEEEIPATRVLVKTSESRLFSPDELLESCPGSIWNQLKHRERRAWVSQLEASEGGRICLFVYF